MIHRLQYFSIVCAGLLFIACASAFVRSISESQGSHIPTHRVVLGELPLLLYTFLFFGFLLPPILPNPQILVVGLSFAALLVAFLIRCFNYGRSREARERADMLAEQQKVAKKIEEAQVRVMTQMEREEFMKRQKPKRVSRYERPPVI